jgi:peptide chain release factor 3
MPTTSDWMELEKKRGISINSTDEIPRFAPECFAWIHSASTAQFKRFRQGLDQLLQEGVVQSFLLRHATRRVPLLAAVGPLQFEVVQYRLQTEYGAESRLETAPWKLLRWVTSGHFDEADLPTGARTATDAAGQAVILFPEDWARAFFAEHHQCRRCRSSIAVERLEAQPDAVLCVQCAEKAGR